MLDHLFDFLTESLRIEGIMRPPLPDEVAATEKFLALQALTVEDVSALVTAYQKGAALRSKTGMDVQVGNHRPPRGGPNIAKKLAGLLENAIGKDAWATHIEYERLHPFMDGNGRSGRAIWAWQRLKRGHRIPKSFLHMWYYETLDGAD